MQSERIAALAQALLAGERRALAKAITLVESSRGDHRRLSADLLGQVLPHSGKAYRIGISGVPGVGKSTFIEALGLYAIDAGHRVAVLAIDPSSSLSGGSILGDKTRMERLSNHAAAFIRPTPARGALGGVANRTREAMLLCEAAGYDIVIVETVGVGQSEAEVAGMSDTFVLLQLPNSGDALQASKRGVIELADIIAVNKADLDPAAAQRMQSQLQQALALTRPKLPEHRPEVILVSALRSQGIAEIWQALCAHLQRLKAGGEFEKQRAQQARQWMWRELERGLVERFNADARIQALLPDLERAVMEGHLSPAAASASLLDHYKKDR